MNGHTSDGALDSQPIPSASQASAPPSGFSQDIQPDGRGRIGVDDEPWPMRAWIMAALSACSGLLFYALVEHGEDWIGERLAFAAATFLIVATVSFVLGVEPRRWKWALAFSLFWGAVAGLVSWQTIALSMGRGPFEWPFASMVLAIIIATPFFQTRRDVAENGRQWKLWQLPYQRLHDHAWIDAVICAAALLFTLISFLLVLMIGGMFGMIGINFISKLMNEGWFVLMLSSGSFGGAVGLLRERDRLVAVMQRLVMAVLSVLAPVLAAAVVLFLLSMLGTGLQTLWSRGFSASYLLLGVAAAALLLANAVIGNVEEDVSPHPVMRMAAAALAVVVLPLAVLSMIGISLRVGQYGWTPDRIWGALAVAVAMAYGLAGVWSVVRGRKEFAAYLRPFQQKLAVAVMLIAFLLATTLIDFGSISTRNQVARLQSGAVSDEKFDWGALAFDFGPSGRQALAELSRSENKPWAASAAAALKAKSRWTANQAVETATAEPLEQRARILPQGAVLTDEARKRISEMPMCVKAYACVVQVMGPKHFVVLTQSSKDGHISQQEYVQNEKGDLGSPEWMENQSNKAPFPDLKTADVEVITVQRQQLRVGQQVQPILQRVVQ